MNSLHLSITVILAACVGILAGIRTTGSTDAGFTVAPNYATAYRETALPLTATLGTRDLVPGETILPGDFVRNGHLTIKVKEVETHGGISYVVWRNPAGEKTWFSWSSIQEAWRPARLASN